MADEDQVDEGQNDNLKDLRRAADDGRKALKEAEALRKELAFAKAGVPTESKLGQLFFNSYDGELTTEAIRTEAEEVGAWRPVTAEPEKANEPTPEERAQSRERADLAADSGHAGINTGDPFRDAEAAFKEARRNGDRSEQAFGAAMTQIIEAHQRGDTRVIPQT